MTGQAEKEGIKMTEIEQLILEKLDELDRKVTSVRITLENDTNKKIDVIGEGHDFLKKRLNEALQMEQKRDIA